MQIYTHNTPKQMAAKQVGMVSQEELFPAGLRDEQLY